MREIKFRGYNAKNKEWLYGCYLINRGEHFICPDGIQPADKTSEDFQIVPETLGQFTGLHDKDGKEIYEGDIIHLGDPTILYDVIWRDCGLMAMQEGTQSFIGLRFWSECITVVGNIHDNPELLKGGEE